MQEIHITEKPGEGRPARVLVVAADPVLLTRIMTAMSDPTAQVTLVPDGIQALALLKDDRWDLVICNYPLPQLLLRNFLREIRSTSCSSRRAGVIVLSITELLSGAQRFIGHGANTVLTRWAPMSQLHAAIQRLLGVAPRFTPPPETRVQITTKDGKRISATRVTNISVTGALVTSTQHPGIGATCVAEIEIPGLDRPIRVPSRVVRYTDNSREFAPGFALHFLDLEPDEAEKIVRLQPSVH